MKTWQGRAAGAGTIVAPAALVSGFPRPAQRGRYASLHGSLVRVSLLGCIVASAACVSTYVVPAGDAGTAALSFEVTGEPTLGYAAYLLKRESPDDHACIIRSQKMAQISVGNPLLKTSNPAEITIPADAEIGLRAMFSPANIYDQMHCSFDLSFIPAKDSAYRVRIHWAPRSCIVELESKEDGIWRPFQADTRRNLC